MGRAHVVCVEVSSGSARGGIIDQQHKMCRDGWGSECGDTRPIGLHYPIQKPTRCSCLCIQSCGIHWEKKIKDTENDNKISLRNIGGTEGGFDGSACTSNGSSSMC